MKKLICVLAILALIPLVCAAEIDLSSMTFDELVALRSQIDLAIWQTQEWQEVTVPQGVWQVGVDIPVGHWTIKAADGAQAWIQYGAEITDKNNISFASAGYTNVMLVSPSFDFYEENSDRVLMDVDAKDGYWFVIASGSAVFSPFTGKPALGFK